MVHEVSTRRCGHEAHILSCFNKSGSRHLPLPSPLRLWFYLYAFPFSRLFWIMLLCWQICIRALFSNLLVWLSMCYIFYLFAFILLPTLLCWAYFNKVWPTEFDDSLQTFSHGTWIRDKVIRLPMKQSWKSAEPEHTDNPHESIVLISWTWCTHFSVFICVRVLMWAICVSFTSATTLEYGYIRFECVPILRHFITNETIQWNVEIYSVQVISSDVGANFYLNWTGEIFSVKIVHTERGKVETMPFFINFFFFDFELIHSKTTSIEILFFS